MLINSSKITRDKQTYLIGLLAKALNRPRDFLTNHLLRCPTRPLYNAESVRSNLNYLNLNKVH